MKKQILLTTLLITSLSSTILGQKFSTPTSGEYTVENCSTCKKETGLVKFTIWIKHRKEENALDLAKVAALKVVLLQGIPGTSVSSSLVTNSQYNNHKKFIDEMMNSSLGLNFVSKSRIDPLRTYKLKKGPFKGYEAAIEVEVQYLNIRQYLVDNSVITIGL